MNSGTIWPSVLENWAKMSQNPQKIDFKVACIGLLVEGQGEAIQGINIPCKFQSPTHNNDGARVFTT